MSTGQHIHQFEKAVLNSNPKQDWIYLSEGNKHIVFQYIKTDCILHEFILKIHKDINEPEDIFASNYIVQKWLGNKYSNQIIHPIHLSEIFVLELVNNIQNKRPAKRMKKHPFNEMRLENNNYNCIYYASLETNACSLNTFCINNKDKNECNDIKQDQKDIFNECIFTFDMKPKWMFLNISPFIDPHNIRKHMCRFSMHQQH
eukprot:60004_1